MLKDWYADTARRVDVFATGDGKDLSAASVKNLVTAMAAMATDPTVPFTLAATQQQELDTVIATNW